MPPKRNPDAPSFQFELNPEKELSQTTLNIYKGYLNKITDASVEKAGQDKRKKPILNKKDLMAKHRQVIDIINEVAGDSRTKKCGMYSAVFYAIGSKNLKKNKKMNALVEAFRSVYYDDKYKEYLEKKKAEESTLNSPDEEE